MRNAARTDANQAPIVEALRLGGCSVYVIGLPVDLVVGKNKRTVLVEIKTEKGGYTRKQSRFMAEWKGGAVVTLRDVAGAVELVRMLDA